MKDASAAIRKAYYNALNNVVTLNSVPVAFYDQVPSNAVFPYIYVSGFTCTEDTTKDTFGLSASLTLTVAAKYPADYGGQTDIDSLAAQITDIVRGTSTQLATQPLSFLPDFINVVTQLSQSNFFRAQALDGMVFYRTLKFAHRVQQAG